MKPLILFGRSLFINDVNVARLIEKYDTVGFNNFATQYPVKYSFTFDQYFQPLDEKTVTFVDCRKQLRPQGAIPVMPIGSYEPIPTRTFNDEGYLKLTRTNFTPCLALNYAIIEGYTDVYLVGIDHVAADTKFAHYDGIDSRFGQNIQPILHEWFRTYVYNCTKYMKIYQTNPAVKDSWNLPFVDIETLYE
jgi:hypothetical protein